MKRGTAALTGQRWLSADERFDAQHDRGSPDDCWLWKGALDQWGRGRIMVRGKNVTSSAFALLRAKGPPPQADVRMVARHRCDNPQCVNPAHLEWGTYSDNSVDCMARKRHPAVAKTHCKRGHLLAGDNLGKPTRGPNDRICKACKRITEQERKARK